MSAEDSHATPMSAVMKLPEPIMTSKASSPPVDMPDYRSLMQDATGPKQASMSDFATQASYIPPEAPGMPTMPHSQPPHMMQQMQQMQQMQSYMSDQYTNQPQGPYQPPLPPEPKLAGEGLIIRVLKENKPTFLVIGIVFLLLLFVVPRLTKMQRFATAEGGLSLTGKLAAAGVAGAAYRLSLFMV